MRRSLIARALLALTLAAPVAHAEWQLQSTRLPASFGGTAAFDPASGQVYGYANGLWQVDLASGAARPLPVLPAPGTGVTTISPLQFDAARGELTAVSLGISTTPYEIHVVRYSIASGALTSAQYPAFSASGTPGLVLDPARDRYLLWGGGLGDTLLSLTLADGVWQRLSAGGTHPPAFLSPMVAMDASRDRMIVYGSVADGPPSTWALDLSSSPTWSQLPVTGTLPTCTRDGRLFVDSVEDQLVLVGDWMSANPDAPVASREVATLPLNVPLGLNWFIRRPYIPPPGTLDAAPSLYQPLVAFDANAGRLWSFGGAQLDWRDPSHDISYDIIVTRRSDSYRLDLRGSNNHWASAPSFGPPALSEPAVAQDPVSHRVFVVGNSGTGNGALTQTFEFVATGSGAGGYLDLAALGGQTIPALIRKKLLVDVPGRRLILVGSTPADPYRPVLHSMPIDGPYVWTALVSPANSPSLRNGMSAVADPRTHRFYFFGGDSAGTYSNSTYMLTVHGAPTWTRVTGPAPSARSGHAAVFDPVSDRMIIFGGRNASGYRSDTWQMTFTDTPNLSQHARQIPVGLAALVPRSESMAFMDAANHRLLVVGGRTPVQTLGDAWELSLDAEVPEWTEIAGTAPVARRAGAALRDDASGRLWLLGGTDLGGTPVTDVWSYEDALTVVGVGPGNGVNPSRTLAMAPPRPNPSLASVTLSFTAPLGSRGRLEVFDVRGRRVRVLPVNAAHAGWNTIDWDGTGEDAHRLPAGIYLCRLEVGGAHSTRRVTLLH
ncbi:MAG: kelch repeat-containing protein [Candidatus Eisenbacteria bacterium]